MLATQSPLASPSPLHSKAKGGDVFLKEEEGVKEVKEEVEEVKEEVKEEEEEAVDEEEAKQSTPLSPGPFEVESGEALLSGGAGGGDDDEVLVDCDKGEGVEGEGVLYEVKPESPKGTGSVKVEANAADAASTPLLHHPPGARAVITITSPVLEAGPGRLFGKKKVVYYSITWSDANGNVVKRTMRRYSDFEWLNNALEAHYPGAILPPLPPKHNMSRGHTSANFVEKRRRAMEEYLQRVVAHPVLAPSAPVRTFLVSSVTDLSTCSPADLRPSPDAPRLCEAEAALSDMIRQSSEHTGATPPVGRLHVELSKRGVGGMLNRTMKSASTRVQLDRQALLTEDFIEAFDVHSAEITDALGEIVAAQERMARGYEMLMEACLNTAANGHLPPALRATTSHWARTAESIAAIHLEDGAKAGALIASQVQLAHDSLAPLKRAYSNRVHAEVLLAHHKAELEKQRQALAAYIDKTRGNDEAEGTVRVKTRALEASVKQHENMEAACASIIQQFNAEMRRYLVDLDTSIDTHVRQSAVHRREEAAAMARAWRELESERVTQSRDAMRRDEDVEMRST